MWHLADGLDVLNNVATVGLTPRARTSGVKVTHACPAMLQLLGTILQARPLQRR